MKRYLSTTKANYRRNSPKPTYFWVIISAAIILAGLIFPWFISNIATIVLYPFHITSTWVKNSDGVIPLYLRSRNSLTAEIEALRQELTTNPGTQLSIKRLVEENIQLRALAKVGEVENRLVARVLVRPDQTSYDVLQIDKGSVHGVKVGAPIFSGLDSVLGLVVHVAPTYSFVDLFTSPGFESTGFIYGPNVFATLEGLGGGVARVKLPQGVAINAGQLVILPGVSNGIYGEIVSVQNEPTQPEQYGYITPPLSINNLLYVSVGLESITIKTEEEIDATVRKFIRDITKLSNRGEFTVASTTKDEFEAASIKPEQ